MRSLPADGAAPKQGKAANREHQDLGLEDWEGSEEGSDEEHSADSEGDET